MHDFLPESLGYVADVIVETRPFWERIDVRSQYSAVRLPPDVIEQLAVTYFDLYDNLPEASFSEYRRRMKALASSELPSEKDAAEVLHRFFDLLCTLFKADVEPFARRKLTAAEIVEGSMAGADWSAVPDDLRYLQGVAESLWRYASPELYEGDLREDLSESEMGALHSIAKIVNREGHGHLITQRQIANDGKNPAFEKMQCIMMLLDELGLLH